MLWHLAEAVSRSPLVEVSEAGDRVEHLTAADAQRLAGLDVAAVRAEVGDLLARVSAEVRGPAAPHRRGTDLVGRDLRRARLRDADLRAPT